MMRAAKNQLRTSVSMAIDIVNVMSNASTSYVKRLSIRPKGGRLEVTQRGAQQPCRHESEQTVGAPGPAPHEPHGPQQSGEEGD
eukprot:CAMPEP_0113583920 /NCGR_PEP_ID=MMETSP0015_2-20120614/32804_1 /TAXON_ID=2838 /ORGANISM="Odontella" /LENGTH=83 /DNA_ID=CAMNT_0000488889 /DNA_START=177 /DNA_END=424 /DNA_ORIENTATION=+ /assembly_acc=CAM_ASM_000160